MSKSPSATPARKAGVAAVSEADGDVKRIEFRGITLELPAQMPSTLLFDIVEIEAAGNNAFPVIRMLRTLLGSEQFLTVREHLPADEPLIDVIGQLVDDILGQYGIGLGE